MTLAVEVETEPEPEPEAIIPDPKTVKRFTVAQYGKLVDVGAFDDGRIELLEGWIVEQVTHNPLHDSTVDRVQELLRDRVSRDWRVRVQSAITTAHSQPDPDVVVAIGPASRYVARHPGPADIAILVEVADSSLDTDRTLKAPVYARTGIPVYWIVNLPERVVEVYANPAKGKYPPATRFGVGDSVPLVVAGQTLPPIPVSEILP
jgi:Uma2 family endonuclease